MNTVDAVQKKDDPPPKKTGMLACINVHKDIMRYYI